MSRVARAGLPLSSTRRIDVNADLSIDRLP